MKFKIIIAFFLFINITSSAQKPCDFSENFVDSIGSYKSTKDYLVYEKVFGLNSSYIFNSIVVNNGVPLLNIQLIEKSKDFIKAKCFDKDSKLFIQLINGKIITLIHENEESCGSMIRDDNGFNNRILTGFFFFRKEDYFDLKTSAISLMRIKYATDNKDFIFKKELLSELDGKMYEPENYFINYFHCTENKN